MSLTDALGATGLDETEGRRILEKLAAELARRGVTADEIGRLSRVSMWQGLTKDDDGNAEIHDLYGFKLEPSWAAGPEWPVVQPPPPRRLPPVKAKRSANGTRTTIILPDPQFGFRRMADGEMIPIHDPDALNASLVAAKALRPDRIVNLGDFSDFAEWSMKFHCPPEFALTTQETVDAGNAYLARQRDLCEHVELLGGNHDDRLGKAIGKNAMAALRLRPGGSPPDAWPLMSMPSVLGLDQIGVKYTGAYPAGRIKLCAGNDEFTPLYAIHGQKLDVVKVAKAERQSFTQGHIHRIASHTETYDLDGRPLYVQAFSPGCLCRTDGAVPSTNSGEDEHGRPVLRYENWQQGMALVTEHDDGAWGAEVFPIYRGRALVRGKTYEAAA